MANRLRNANIASSASAIDHHNHRLIIPLMQRRIIFMTFTPRIKYLAADFKFVYNRKTCGLQIGHGMCYILIIFYLYTK